MDDSLLIASGAFDPRSSDLNAWFNPEPLAGPSGLLDSDLSTDSSALLFKYQGTLGADIIAFGSGLGPELAYLSAISGTGTVAFGDGVADTIIWNFTDPASLGAAGNVKEIIGFEAGSGSDVLSFAPGLLRDEDRQTASSQILSRSVVLNFNAASTNLATAATERVFLQFAGSGELANPAFAAGTSQAGAASVAALIGSRTVSSNQRLLLSLDDGTDSYLWYFDNSRGVSSARLEASELTLVGVVRGVTTLSNGDITVANSALVSVNVAGSVADDLLRGTDQADLILPLAGNDTVNAGGGADLVLLDPASGFDLLSLGFAGAGDGAADRVLWNFTQPSALASAGQTNTILGFESGTDVLEFVQGLLAEKDGSTAVASIRTTILNATASADLLGSNGIVFHQFSGIGDLAAGAATRATEVAAQLSNWKVESSTRYLYLLDDGTDSYVWYHAYNGNDARKNEIDANELTLLAVVSQVTSFNSGDLRVVPSTVSPTVTVAREPFSPVTTPRVSVTSVGGADGIVSAQAGDNLVRGQATAGLPVQISFNGTVLGSATADPGGVFQYTLSAADLALIGEGGSRTLLASQDNGSAGLISSNPFNFAVDRVAPAVVISAAGGADSLVTLEPGDNTVVGSAEANRSVTLSSGSTVLGSSTANGSGQFTYTLTAANLASLGEGAGKLITATQSDAAGNSGSSSAFSFAIDATPVSLSISSVGGADRVVSSQVGDNTVTGIGRAGTLVTLSSGGVSLGTTLADPSGAFSYTLTSANLVSLGQGTSRSVVASQIGSSGALLSSAGFQFSVDTVAPAVVISAAGGADSLVTLEPGDNTVVGSAEANRSVTLSSGSTVLGSSTANGSGQFTYTLTAANLASLGEGAGKLITATQSDAAGNSGSSSAFSFAIDTSTPPPPPTTDDFSASTGTTGQVAVGGFTTGTIESSGDRDWFRVSLQAGRSYAFSLNGVSLVDPQLRLRNGSGVELAENNDANNTRNAEILFTIAAGGTYFLEAASSNDVGTGSYRVAVTDVTPLQPPSYSSVDGYGEVSVARALDLLTGQPLTRSAPLGGVFWGLDRIGAPTAWNAGVTGQGVVVAVIDTGVDYFHPDLDANIWTNVFEIAGNGLDDDQNGFIDDTRGWDFFSNDNTPLDGNGHGTHVAGTIAAERNSFGQTGVAFNAKIMPLRSLGDNGSGSWDAVSRSIYYAADNGADVINLSLGSPSASQQVLDALRYAYSRGVVVVSAAGNSSAASPGYPAAYAAELGLAVGAVDRNGALASFSNRAGSTVIDYVTAAGVSVYSTLPNNRYGTYSGTSMATPHVAGAVALLLSYRPNLTPAEIETLLVTSAKPDANAQLSGDPLLVGGATSQASFTADVYIDAFPDIRQAHLGPELRRMAEQSVGEQSVGDRILEVGPWSSERLLEVTERVELGKLNEVLLAVRSRTDITDELFDGLLGRRGFRPGQLQFPLPTA